jgi:hypothetical protein
MIEYQRKRGEKAYEQLDEIIRSFALIAMGTYTDVEDAKDTADIRALTKALTKLYRQWERDQEKIPRLFDQQ